jgi:hypothetical protein
MMKSRRMRWAGHVVRRGTKRNAYRILVGKPEGTRPLGRLSRRCDHNTKMDLGEIGWVIWTGLIWLRMGPVEGSCEHFNEILGSLKF